MAVDLLHARFTRMMPRQLFTSLLDVEVKTVTQDDAGQEVETWDVVNDHLRNVPCAFVPVTATGETQQQMFVSTANAWLVLLSGDYAEITTRHRVRIDDVAYDVDAVEVDGTGTLTRLRVSQIGV